MAYEMTSEELLGDIPENASVTRTIALDTMRHLGFKGRYPSFLAIPDRWASWVFGGVLSGLWRILRDKPKIIWSTYPIATAHLVAFILHKLTGLPWVADFRDPMVEYNERTGEWAPKEDRIRKARLWIEYLAINHASKLVFCTHGALHICRARYDFDDESKFVVLSNGYDERTFVNCEKTLGKEERVADTGLRVVHSGVLYGGTDRDPRPLFEAMRHLVLQGNLTRNDLHIVFRGSGADSRYKKDINDLELDDYVDFKPSCTYHNSITEMLNADGLLVLQGYTSNPAIPAKVYEYLRAGKPILALVDKEGETAALLRKFDGVIIAQPDSIDSITRGLVRYLGLLRDADAGLKPRDDIMDYSRDALTGKLAGFLDEIVCH